MNLHAIVNPVAGACKQRAELRGVLRTLAASGNEVTVRTTLRGGDARRMAAEAVAAGAEVVLAVGGDGTVCEVADGLAGSRVALVIWPAGTENLVAKSLGFSASAESLLDCLERGVVRPLDVGIVNGRSFLVVVGVGFDAEVVHRLTCGRRGHIEHLSYAGPIWRTFWEHRFPPVEVRIDQGEVWRGQGMVFVGNMARYALGLPVVRDARADDGLLDLLIMPCRGKMELIGHSLRTLMGTHVEHPGVVYRRVRHVRVEAPRPVHVEMDGDVCGGLPIEVNVRPSALFVRIPSRAGSVYNPPS